jgi:histidine triad (HIT) family protein
MADCLFCQIVAKKVPAKIVYEDEAAVGFLDIAPRTQGMTILVPKKHYKEFNEDLQTSSRLMHTSLLIAESIKETLHPQTVEFAVIPSPMIPHFHIKLYPVYDREKEMPLIENQPQQATELELNNIAEKIRAVKIDMKQIYTRDYDHPQQPLSEFTGVGEKTEAEQKAEKKQPRKKDEVYWMKREVDIG